MRLVYGIEYGNKGPDGRKIGAMLSGVGMIAIIILSIYIGVELLIF
jgi:hypothetical protein